MQKTNIRRFRVRRSVGNWATVSIDPILVVCLETAGHDVQALVELIVQRLHWAGGRGLPGADLSAASISRIVQAQLIRILALSPAVDRRRLDEVLEPQQPAGDQADLFNQAQA